MQELNRDLPSRQSPSTLSTAALAIVLAVLLLSPAARCENIVLTGATVHTVTGTAISAGQVWIKDGKIEAVGKTVSAPNATSLDLKGLHLYPGMVELNSVLGLTEI